MLDFRTDDVGGSFTYNIILVTLHLHFRKILYPLDFRKEKGTYKLQIVPFFNMRDQLDKQKALICKKSHYPLTCCHGAHTREERGTRRQGYNSNDSL